MEGYSLSVYITSAETRLGPEGDLLNTLPSACRRVELESPILTNAELSRLRHLTLPGLKVATLPIHFSATRGSAALPKALEHLFTAANDDIPTLLAVAGLHHYLIRTGLRTKVSLVAETGEARQVHHAALLIGYDVSAINPYLAFDTTDGHSILKFSRSPTDSRMAA